MRKKKEMPGLFMPKLILSLYDYSGNWCKEYKDHPDEYEVVQVDKLLNGIDVRLMKYIDGRKVHGILSATPCTYFSQARKKPNNDELLIALSTVDATMRMITIYQPVWWCIENPAKSRINHYIGKPRQIVQWNWFGDNIKKPTGLWGNFNRVKVNSSIANTEIIPFENKTKSKNAITPIEFGKAFYEANR